MFVFQLAFISQLFFGGITSVVFLFKKKVIYAINAGGEAHVDIHGISYRRDPLLGRNGRGGDGGTASAFGRTLLIARSPIPDQILYQTER